MAITISASDQAVPGAPLAPRLSTPQVWGIVLFAPYLLVFRGLRRLSRWATASGWRALRRIYVALYNDPIFARAAVNTLIFLLIGINVKMVIALFLSGFFVQQRTWIRWLSVMFILPWAVPSIPTILSVRFMLNPEWGMVNQLIFKLTGDDGPNWLNDPTLALVDGDRRPYLEVAAVLDADPAGRSACHPARALRGRRRRRRQLVAELPLHHLAVDADALCHLHAALDDLDGGRLQQRLSADRRRPGRPHPRAVDARHPLSAARPGRPRDGLDRLRLPFVLPLVFS